MSNARSTPEGYQALDSRTVLTYLTKIDSIADRLGGDPTAWTAREVGDGNLNLVFIIQGLSGHVCVKQALPYVRLVGESWPLPLDRAHFEHLALVEEAVWAKGLVPAVLYHDAPMALTVMEFLTPHIILRKGLIHEGYYPNMAKGLGQFLALSLYHTSDLHLGAKAKKEKIAAYLTNTAMCQISEDLIFDEPYFDAEMNRHTSPQLDVTSDAFKEDVALKAAVQEMKWRFLNHAEALLHGDLHTGSVMVTDEDTRVIDPEFAFYGPMGFDIGMIVGNLLMAYFAQPGHGDRDAYQEWILAQVGILYRTFEEHFAALWMARDAAQRSGDVYQPRLSADAPGLAKEGLKARLTSIWSDTLGFAGCEMIRRILGLAHVEDFESIVDTDMRASCELEALEMGRRLLVDRDAFADIDRLIAMLKE